jgi:putative thioredoxin
MNNDNFDFDKDVIARSHEVAVVVDYWSPTCGPCLFLGPILEKLASDGEGKWELVKINTNEHNRLAYEHGISSIPHVKMFSKGKLVSEFVGALPEGTLVKWLDEFIPTEAKEQLAAIRERLSGQDRGTALADLRVFVAAHPELPMAGLVLASEIVFEAPEDAIALVQGIQLGDLLWESAENIRLLAELGTFEDTSGTEVGKQLSIAREALHANDFDAAMQAMIAAVEADKAFSKELPRRGAIALFRMFGSQHPLTIKYRRRFEMALY